MAARKDRWKLYDEDVSAWAEKKLPPAFIQEVLLGGLWCIQELKRPTAKRFGWLHRILYDPPRPCDWQPFYNGWPGDHRGWMNFQTAEEARDFYKFATRRMSFDEYRMIEKRPYSGKRIDLDDAGNFNGELNVH